MAAICRVGAEIGFESHMDVWATLIMLHKRISEYEFSGEGGCTGSSPAILRRDDNTTSAIMVILSIDDHEGGITCQSIYKVD